MRRLRQQGGQASVEYLGVLIVATLLVAALLVSDMPARLMGGMERAVCLVLQGDNCPPPPGTAPAPPAPPAVDPQLSAQEREALLGHPSGAQSVLEDLSEAERRWLELKDPEAAEGVERATEWRQQVETVDRYIDAPLEEFLEYRDSAGRDERLDWSTDECSAPVVGSTGISFDFTNACLRHDFGYRNTKALGLFDQRKAEIDNRFLADMKDHCATRSVFLQSSCYRWAYTFYHAVRRFG